MRGGIVVVWLALAAALAVPLAWLCFGGPNAKPLDRFLRGVGWAALCSSPALIILGVQAGVSGLDWEGLVVIPMAWWMLLGGESVYLVCQLLGSWMSGEEHPSVETELILFLAVVQTAVVAGIVASRLRKCPTVRDPGILLIGGLVLVNSVLLASQRWFTAGPTP